MPRKCEWDSNKILPPNLIVPIPVKCATQFHQFLIVRKTSVIMWEWSNDDQSSWSDWASPFNYSTDPIVTCVRCLARTHSHKRHDAINSRCLSPGTSPLDQPTVITFETNARFLTLSFSWPYCRLSNSERICSSWPDKFNSSGIMFAATFIQWFLARRSPHPTNHQFTHVTPDFFMDSPIIAKRRTK